MLRYCTNCRQDFDFAPRDITGPDDLICPKCGSIIGKNSRHPVSKENEKIEENVGNAIASIWNIAYMFYVTLSIIGIVGYFFSDKIFYLMVAITVAAYILQLITGTTTFTEGIIFLPIGAAIGYFVIGSIKGACLGILVVFLIRHILRDILWNLVNWLIRWGRS